MLIREILQKKGLSKYRAAKNSGIPYMTLNDLCNGKTSLAKCSADTVYRLSMELGIAMEELLAPYFASRPAFDLFRSNVCHRLKEMGDVDYLIDALSRDEIRAYYRQGRYPECLYLLAMADYLSRVNDVPLCSRYDDLRKMKLERPLFPSGIITAAAVHRDESIKERAVLDAIPEFIRFNIVEGDVRDVT